MKHLQKLVLALAGSFTLLACNSAKAQIIISEVDPTGSSDTATYAADWFELTNTGTSAVDITGWKMDDNSNSFALAVPLSLVGNSIAPGQSVVFVETTGSSLATIAPKFESAWFGSDVPAGFTIGGYGGSGVGLSSSSDAVNIFNGSGVLQANVTFGASTAGITFDNRAGTNGAISTNSSASVNGAFLSPAGEIGSPGATPEPSTWALMLGGALMLLVRRRNSAAKA